MAFHSWTWLAFIPAVPLLGFLGWLGWTFTSPLRASELSLSEIDPQQMDVSVSFTVAPDGRGHAEARIVVPVNAKAIRMDQAAYLTVQVNDRALPMRLVSGGGSYAETGHSVIRLTSESIDLGSDDSVSIGIKLKDEAERTLATRVPPEITTVSPPPGTHISENEPLTVRVPVAPAFSLSWAPAQVVAQPLPMEPSADNGWLQFQPSRSELARRRLQAGARSHDAGRIGYILTAARMETWQASADKDARYGHYTLSVARQTALEYVIEGK